MIGGESEIRTRASGNPRTNPLAGGPLIATWVFLQPRLTLKNQCLYRLSQNGAFVKEKRGIWREKIFANGKKCILISFNVKASRIFCDDEQATTLRKKLLVYNILFINNACFRLKTTIGQPRTPVPTISSKKCVYLTPLTQKFFAASIKKGSFSAAQAKNQPCFAFYLTQKFFPASIQKKGGAPLLKQKNQPCFAFS